MKIEYAAVMPLRRIRVEIPQVTTPSSNQLRQKSSRIDLGGSADNHQDVAAAKRSFNGVHVADGLTKKHDMWFKWLAAHITVGDIGLLVMVGHHRYEIAAPQTVQMVVIAMHFIDSGAAGAMMQVIYILGDGAMQKTAFFELSQGMVSFVGDFSAQRFAQRPIEQPGLLRIGSKYRKGRVLLGRIDAPESTRAAKIGNPTGHRDTSAGKGKNLVGLSQSVRRLPVVFRGRISINDNHRTMETISHQ